MSSSRMLSQYHAIALFPLVAIMVLISITTTVLYSHPQINLSGAWILDDKGTITMNPVVVNPEVPWKEVWTRDFWGHHQLSESRSHKSWRPLCTATYRLQRIYAYGETELNDPFWFHLMDRVLHGFVTALVFPVAGYNLRFFCNDYEIVKWSWKHCALWVTAFFAVHPIHVESVANSTGRAEVLCALFYLMGFLFYARMGVGLSLEAASFISDHAIVVGWKVLLARILGVLLMLSCTLASLLCKEHGVTLPIMCVVWDAYIGTATSIPELLAVLSGTRRFKEYYGSMRNNESEKEATDMNSSNRQRLCMMFLLRTAFCILGCLSLAMWRVSKNGSSNPDFVCEQNPAACESDAFIRFYHFGYLWCLNFWQMLCPSWLSPDWSCKSIQLMEKPSTDPRFPLLFLLWITLIIFLCQAALAAFTALPFTDTSISSLKKSNGSKIGENDCYREENKVLHYHTRRRTIVTCFLWMLLPFLMSSNLLVYVGFVIADRTLYLPSFGFCLLLVEGLVILPSYFHESDSVKIHMRKDKVLKVKSLSRGVSYSWCCALVVLILYTTKQQVQTKRWSDQLILWEEGYRINPGSCIAGKEYGMALVNVGRNKDAAEVLMKLHKREMSRKELIQSIENSKSKEDDQTSSMVEKAAEMGRLANLMTTRFKLVTAMGNAGDCANAIPLIDEGITMIENVLHDIEIEQQRPGYEEFENETKLHSFNEAKGGMIQNKSFFFVAKSRCAIDFASMAIYAHYAVTTMPGLDYARAHAESVSNIANQIKAAGLDSENIGLTWTKDPDGQTAQLGFTMRTGK